jgi:hypothetical protein
MNRSQYHLLAMHLYFWLNFYTLHFVSFFVAREHQDCFRRARAGPHQTNRARRGRFLPVPGRHGEAPKVVAGRRDEPAGAPSPLRRRPMPPIPCIHRPPDNPHARRNHPNSNDEHASPIKTPPESPPPPRENHHQPTHPPSSSSQPAAHARLASPPRTEEQPCSGPTPTPPRTASPASPRTSTWSVLASPAPGHG